MAANKLPYQPVPQEVESEEELTIYNRKFGEGVDKYEENVELIFRRRNDKKSKRLQNSSTSPIMQMIACGIVILIALFIAIIIGTIMSLWKQDRSLLSPSTNSTQRPTTPPPATNQPSPTPVFNFVDDPNSWRSEFHNGLSEMSLLLHDVDKDGTQDVILSNVSTRLLMPGYGHCPGSYDRCKDEFGFSPCQVRLLALNGLNGAVIWSKWVQYAPFASKCEVDLNRDGKKDCLFAGRKGSFAAFDVHNDVLLWVVDQAITCPAYNYFFPLVSKDFDNDGIPDIIVTHGGDPLYPDSEKKRTPGFLAVVSGLTGRQISDHILMPDNHETYSSPVLYTLPDDKELVLFGSGGETIAGSLWAISLESLTEHVREFIKTQSHKNSVYSTNKHYKPISCYTQQELEASRPGLHSGVYSATNYERWMDKCPSLAGNVRPIWNKFQVCAYELVPAGTAGTILPPVIIDVNRDGNMDLIVSQFSDHTLLYNGATGMLLWDHYMPNTQTYSIPAPLHFNDDETYDVLLRFNKGQWLAYDYSYMGVLDGNNGELLWSLNCSQAIMSSPLTLQSKVKGQGDAMMFIGIGCGVMSAQMEEEKGEDHKSGDEKRVQQKKRHLVCPRRHFEAEFGSRECAIVQETTPNQRHSEEKRQGFVPLDVDSSGEEYVAPVPQENSLDVDFSQYLPEDLWQSADPSDTFPDPWKEPEDFITKYCGLNYDLMEASVYFLTPELIKENARSLLPVFSFQPFVHRATSVGSSRSKRHGESDNADPLIEEIKKLMKDRKGLRCAHVMAPLVSVGTPVITDLTGDGKFEAIITLGYTAASGEYSIPYLDFLHPPKLMVQSFTIENRLKAIYGESASTSVDTSSYYPIDKQPWIEYMGSHGNGIFVDPSDN